MYTKFIEMQIGYIYCVGVKKIRNILYFNIFNVKFKLIFIFKFWLIWCEIYILIARRKC